MRQKDSPVLRALHSNEYDRDRCIDLLVYAGRYVVFQGEITVC